MELGDPPAECACGIFGGSVVGDLLYRLPGGVGTVRRGLPTAGADHVVTTLYEGRHEIRSHMPLPPITTTRAMPCLQRTGFMFE
jgi:hypothetical protein